MIILHSTVYKGEIEYVGLWNKDDIVKEFFQIYFPENQDHWIDCCNLISSYYCYDQIMEWLVNKKLKDGYVLIGSDGRYFLMTKKGNLEKKEKFNEIL
jgi:hypothetical protein